MDSPAVNAKLPSPVHRAIVDSGAIETEYLRAGHGPTVLYLGGALTGAAQRESMFAALASCFRVIAPQSTSLSAMAAPQHGGASAFTQWLLGVLDGLGLGRASLVVEAPLAAETARFVVRHGSRVDRVIFFGGDERHDWSELLPATLSLPGNTAAIAEAIRFLAADHGHPVASAASFEQDVEPDDPASRPADASRRP